MVGREADRHVVPAEVAQAQRGRVLDQQPEQALALGQVAHGGTRPFVHAHVDELGQIVARAEDPQRAVAGSDEIDGGLDDALQRRVELQTGRDGEDGAEQLLHVVTRGHDLVHAVSHLVEQLVEVAAAGRVRHAD